ncbi:hypothetical protein MKW92_000221 [Papaver armeniacum]|nr:hypothetical protein MKW92_000221 [Papaver armeniacum]
MALFSGLKIGSFLPIVVGLVLACHVVMLVEGGRSIASRLSKEEDLELERQLNILNKPPIKTMHTRRGDIYDCVEFHKQPAFDHPLLKNRSILDKHEVAPRTPHKTLLMSQIEECPTGTVPIRRTTKEDLIRAKYLSSPSNGAPGYEYRAGVTLQSEGKNFVGASGIANVWHPKVNPDQSSGAEVTLLAGPAGQTNEIRFGWTANPQLYGDDLSSTYAYWTSDGGHTTGCYNTMCPGFVQVDQKYTPAMILSNISVVGGQQFGLNSNITQCERETGKWWLILEGKINIGYWPQELFPLFASAPSIYLWGGRVKSGEGGIPEMGSGNLPNRFLTTPNDDIGIPDGRVQFTVDCKESYNSIWDNEHTVLHYGGPGGITCA